MAHGDDGWLRIENFLSTDDVERVLRDCRALLAVPAEERRRGDKPASGTRHLTELDERSATLRDLMARPALIDAVGQILRPSATAGDGVRSFRPVQVSFRSPQPGFGGQRLHTDGIANDTAEATPTIVTAIVALVDFTEANGATRLVPGSHRRPDLQRAGGTMDHHPDEILLTGAAGSAFVFSGHILHSGTPNRSGEERPALQLTWATPDARVMAT